MTAVLTYGAWRTNSLSYNLKNYYSIIQVNNKDGAQSLLSCFFLPLLKRIVSTDREEEAMELGSCWADDPSVRYAFNILLESAPMAVALHVNIVVPYFCVVLKDIEK